MTELKQTGKKQGRKKADPRVRTFFLLAFPTLLIIALAMINPDTWWSWIILAVYQFVLLKQFVDQHYDFLS